jgi:hypothetical protein
VPVPTDYAQDVRKHAAVVIPAAVEGIVKYLGSSLRKPDSASVAPSDPVELRRLRESFLKRRLRVDLPDPVLDEALRDVMARMSGDRDRSRVTVCYLLAERFGRLALFV